MSGERTLLVDFGYSSSVSLDSINDRVEEFKQKGYTDFEVGINFGYYQGEEEIALFGRKNDN